MEGSPRKDDPSIHPLDTCLCFDGAARKGRPFLLIHRTAMVACVVHQSDDVCAFSRR